MLEAARPAIGARRAEAGSRVNERYDERYDDSRAVLETDLAGPRIRFSSGLSMSRGDWI
jgi:hypothetical protein